MNKDITLARGPLRGHLLEEIGRYLTSSESAKAIGPLGARLLQAVVQYLKQEQRDETVATADPTPPVLEAVQTTLQTIQDRLDKIEKQGTAKSQRPATYAAAAKSNASASAPTVAPKKKTTTKTATDQEKLLEAYRSKEIVVCIAETREKNNVQHMTTCKLVEATRGTTPEVVGVSHLPSGDLKVFVRTAEAKEKLQSEPVWLSHIAESASIQHRTYAVTAHGIRVQPIDASNQKAVIAHLIASNATFHPGLRVVKVSWPARILKEGKIYSALRIEVEAAEAANRLITESLLVDYEVKRCERFAGDCKVTQCYNCQQYGHMRKSCRNQVKCGHCTGGHVSQKCDNKKSRRCAVCGEVSHEAWSKFCRIQKELKLRSDKAYKNRPVMYQTSPELIVPLFSSSNIDKNAFNFTASNVSAPNIRQEPEYTIVSNKRKKTTHPTSAGAAPKDHAAIGGTNALSILMNVESQIKGFAKPKVGRPRIDKELSNPWTVKPKVETLASDQPSGIAEWPGPRNNSGIENQSYDWPAPLANRTEGQVVQTNSEDESILDENMS